MGAERLAAPGNEISRNDSAGPLPHAVGQDDLDLAHRQTNRQGKWCRIGGLVLVSERVLAGGELCIVRAGRIDRAVHVRADDLDGRSAAHRPLDERVHSGHGHHETVDQLLSWSRRPFEANTGRGTFGKQCAVDRTDPAAWAAGARRTAPASRGVAPRRRATGPRGRSDRPVSATLTM